MSMQVNMPKSNEGENWLGWIILGRWRLKLTLKIVLLRRKLHPSKLPYYLLLRSRVCTSADSLTLDQLTVQDLCRATGTSAVSAKRAALYWATQGVLKEVSTETFQVLEHADSTTPQTRLPMLF